MWPISSNTAIADAFDELADLYELDGAVVHRVLAYRTAAKNVRNAPVSVAELTSEGRVTSCRASARRSRRRSGRWSTPGRSRRSGSSATAFPPGLAAITRLPGVGPKRVRTMYDQLGIDSIEALREAAETGRLRDAKGFGPKFEESVLAALDAGAGRPAGAAPSCSTALEVGEQVAEALRAHPAADTVEIAGSARRLADSVKDLDIVAAATDPAALPAALAELDAIESVAAGRDAARGRARTTACASTCASSRPTSSATCCSTSPARRHNVALREAAVRRGPARLRVRDPRRRDRRDAALRDRGGGLRARSGWP